jgi:hypothetical protein
MDAVVHPVVFLYCVQAPPPYKGFRLLNVESEAHQIYFSIAGADNIVDRFLEMLLSAVIHIYCVFLFKWNCGFGSCFQLIDPSCVRMQCLLCYKSSPRLLHVTRPYPRKFGFISHKIWDELNRIPLYISRLGTEP